ncbi:succinylglutamate desuccinylase/aspartoacylase family protein [Salinirubellus sp. GCM10025818]|uniref:succinylglutamate desuccinylase/aspartoacylase family protein n=1 Tax=Salinirubellus TaxID=2162630 RepID=UPI0030D2519B
MSGHTAERITLVRLPSGVPIQTRVHTYGDGDGPTLYVQAAQHGREINGTATLRRLHERLDPTDVSGTLVAVPVADPLTFDQVAYTTTEPIDSVNPNMNRVWPGDESGTLHERMAARLWSLAGEADAIVDLHTASRDSLTHVVFREDDADSRDLAEAFGTDLLLAELADEEADEEWHARDFGGKLRVAASEEGIPSITPELAHNKEIVESAVETGVSGVMNVLRELGMLPDSPQGGTPPLYRNHLGRVTAEDSGLFRVEPGVEIGQEVEAGEHVGTLYDPTSYEVLQRVETDRAGLLYTVTRESTVNAGDSLVRVALPLDG